MVQWVVGLNVHTWQPDNLSLLPRGQAKVDNSTVILSPPRAHCGVHSSPPVSLPPSPHTTHLKKNFLKTRERVGQATATVHARSFLVDGAASLASWA